MIVWSSFAFWIALVLIADAVVGLVLESSLARVVPWLNVRLVAAVELGLGLALLAWVFGVRPLG
jgi:hypothetical protein